MSRMSAPAAAMRRACSMARCGSRKWPPSEKLSGVTLRTPITTGRPRPKSRASSVFTRAPAAARAGCDGVGRAWLTPLALRRPGRGVKTPGLAGVVSRSPPKSLCVPSDRRPGSHLQLASPVALGPFGAILVGDLQLELLGVLDPPDHELLGGAETDELLLLVGLRHRLGEDGGLAIAQLTHRVHAGFVQP